MDIEQELKDMISSNKIVLFMKGTPDAPQCGFSMQTAQVLKSCNVEFAYVDILSAPGVRENLPKVSNWPTFPQVFVSGELVGGCDITLDLYQKGELQSLVDATSDNQ
jgi:monothiol glutaredoxin